MMWECAVPGLAPWGGGHLFWGLGTTALIIAVLVGLFFLLGRRKADKTRRADREDSLDILKVRLAKGEIDPQAYQAMKKILEQA